MDIINMINFNIHYYILQITISPLSFDSKDLNYKTYFIF